MKHRKFHFDEVNLHSLVTDILKNLWVVVLICASAIFCFTALSLYGYEPQFTSSATLMVSAKDSNSAYNSLTTTQSMASVFAEVFQSKVLRDKIEEQSGEPFTGTITPHVIPQTNILVVSVTDSTPQQAFRAMNLVLEHYSAISDYLFANAQLEVIKDPLVPVAPSNPLDIRSKYPVVVLLSAILGVAAVAVLSILRDTVQTPRAARRKLDARLLRTIHHEERNKTARSKFRRKNAAPLISSPLISKTFIEDNLNLCSAVDYHMRKREQKVMLVTSAGENEGKSTVAANMALSMAKKGKKVLLLDCDFRKPSLHKIFEVEVPKGDGISGYLASSTMEAPRLLQLEKYGQFCLGVSHVENRSIHHLVHSDRLKDFLQGARQEYDCIILDTPPMLAATDAEALAQLADTAMLVVRTDFMYTAAVNDSLDKLRRSARDLCGIVLNNFHSFSK